MWAFAGLALWVARNLVNARVGRVLRALRESEAAAEAMGVDTAAEKRRVFVLSAVYASVAGSLYAHYITVISPEIYSFLFSVVLVLMVAIGGIGLYWGAVVGAVLLTVLPEALRRFGDWEVPLYGLALIVVILFLPRGIAGLFAREGRALAPARSSTLPSSPPPSLPASAPPSAGQVSVARAHTGPLLEIRGVTKQFGGVRAVHDCSFGVADGEIKAVIGPNGAGKTTLFNVITGFYAPTAGEVRLRGVPVTALAAHRLARLGLSRTFQNLQLFPGLTVIENVMIGCERDAPGGFLGAAFALPGPRRRMRVERARAERALATVGLEHAALSPAGSLAFGQQKLVEVARALAAEPDAAPARRARRRAQYQREGRDDAAHRARARRRHLAAHHRARHAPRDGGLRSRGGAGPRREDRGGAALRGAAGPRGDPRLPRRGRGRHCLRSAGCPRATAPSPRSATSPSRCARASWWP